MQNDQSNQCFQRTPQQQKSFQQFNPRFTPGYAQDTPVCRHEPPNFLPPNNMVQNMHGNTYPYNQRNKNDISYRQNDQGQDLVNCHPHMVSSTMSPQQQPPFQNFDNVGRFNAPAQFSNGPHFQDIHRSEWQQQISSDLNSMIHQQPFNSSNQLSRNLSFQGDLQQEKQQKESTDYKQSQDDQRWLQFWLQNRKQETNPSPKNKPMKVFL